MDKILSDNLKRMQQICLSNVTKKTQRNFIMHEISQTDKAKNYKINRFEILPFVFKPMAYIVAIATLFITGSFYTMSATNKSLPGSAFYPVKISWEKLQVSMINDNAKKTKKQIELADRRLNELSSLTDKKVSPVEKQEKVAQVVRYFNSSLQEAQISLSKAQKENESQEAETVKIVNLVNDKSDDFVKVLDEHQKEIPTEVKSVIVKQVNEIRTQSLSYLITKYQQHSKNVKKDVIITKLNNRLVVFGEWASRQDDKEIKKQALGKLNVLQNLLHNEKFADTLTKIQEFSIWQENIEKAKQTSGEVLGASEIKEMEKNKKEEVEENNKNEIDVNDKQINRQENQQTNQETDQQENGQEDNK